MTNSKWPGGEVGGVPAFNQANRQHVEQSNEQSEIRRIRRIVALELDRALDRATRVGLLDELAEGFAEAYGSVNDVCDALASFIAQTSKD